MTPSSFSTMTFTHSFCGMSTIQSRWSTSPPALLHPTPRPITGPCTLSHHPPAPPTPTVCTFRPHGPLRTTGNPLGLQVQLHLPPPSFKYTDLWTQPEGCGQEASFSCHFEFQLLSSSATRLTQHYRVVPCEEFSKYLDEPC